MNSTWYDEGITVLAGTGHTKKCRGTHTGETPIVIGGFNVYLGAKFYITSEALAAVDIVLPLCGGLPDKLKFNTGKYVIQCELADHGGVPATWGEFIDKVAELMQKYTVMAYCVGSHGRTGCFAASLLAKLEPAIEDPIEEIRKRHCPHAVESLLQAKAVFTMKGLPLPAKYKDAFKEYSYASTTGGYQPWQKGWFKGKTYLHDMKECACPACVAELNPNSTMIQTTRRDTPCLCNRWKSCSEDRAEFSAHLVELEAAKLTPAASATTGTLTPMPPGQCRKDTACFCSLCQLEDIALGPHDTTRSDLCCCAACVLRYKLTIRGDWEFLHKATGHTGQCLCPLCWYTAATHELACSCPDCIYLNLQPAELEEVEGPQLAADPIPPNSTWNTSWDSYECLTCHLGTMSCRCEDRVAAGAGGAS